MDMRAVVRKYVMMKNRTWLRSALMPACPWASTQAFPYADKLSRLVKDSNPAGKVAFYMSMARKNGDNSDIQSFPQLATYGWLQNRLNEAYARMALGNRGILVPVDEARQRMREQETSLELYSGEVHPNLTGS